MISNPPIRTAEEGTKPALMPKVRFREFRGGASWTIETLEDALAMSATYGIVTAGEFQKRGIPMLRGGDIKEGRIGDGLPFVTAEINSQYRRTILQANDVVISLVGYPGEAAVVPPRYVGANISRAVGLLRVKHLLSAPFLVCYLNSPAGKRTVLKPSAGSAQVVVNLKQLNALLIPTPAPAEQQKIADCLSSVDELIAAQARKVSALKTHKKGLMQQLFPREGETQPRLRFPEFQNAGEWEESPLSKFILSLDAGVSVNSGDRPASKTEFGVLKTSAVTNGIFECEENKVVLSVNEQSRLKEPVSGGTIIISRMNTPALVGANAYVESSHENLFLPDRLWAAKPREGVSMRFLAFILGSDKGRVALSKLAKGSSGSMKNITKPEVLAFSVIATSSAEQHRIATCLSSLDALITAETQKHEALKTHKKGLMQQLFPSPEEVEA